MRRNQRIFIFLFTFFCVVAIGSILFLNGKSSVFYRNRDSFGAETATLTDTVIGNTELASNLEKSDVIDASTESSSLEVKVEVKENSATEEFSNEPEANAEASVEISIEEPESNIKYYKFKVVTEKYNLRLREEPSSSAHISEMIKKGETGYVLKTGDVWTKVYTELGNIGYCSSEYLELTEVEKSDYPTEIQDLVEAPDEAASLTDETSEAASNS
ncbi:MAG: SH3 domain-containing protein [Butyrivibrio sp.]|nr:SH3 domain-containing protein [Butyrivibrio sp.]